jgi:hypothetical protein
LVTKRGSVRGYRPATAGQFREQQIDLDHQHAIVVRLAACPGALGSRGQDGRQGRVSRGGRGGIERGGAAHGLLELTRSDLLARHRDEHGLHVGLRQACRQLVERQRRASLAGHRALDLLASRRHISGQFERIEPLAHLGARAIRTHVAQLRIEPVARRPFGAAAGRAVISTVCPLASWVFSGTMAPSTRAPRQRWPRSVCST